MVDGAGGSNGAAVGSHHRQVRRAVVLLDGELWIVVLNRVCHVVCDLAMELISKGGRGHVLDEL